MGFAVDLISMDLGSEGGLQLPRLAAEPNPIASAGAILDMETLRFEPGQYGAIVGGTEAKTDAKLFRREPTMIARRRTVLLVFEQTLQVRLLRRGGLEHDRDVRDFKGRFNGALIESRLASGRRLPARVRRSGPIGPVMRFSCASSGRVAQIGIVSGRRKQSI